MMTMREKIARAIGDRYETSQQPGDLRAHRPRDEVLFDLADAVLAAMREPDGELLETILERSTVWDWQQMIDAASA